MTNLTQYGDKLERLSKTFDKKAAAAGLLIENVMTGYLGKEMKLQKQIRKETYLRVADFKTERKLYARSGNLFRSFGSRTGSTITKSTYSNDIISLVYGSSLPYANIQNDGGRVVARKFSNVKRNGKVVGRMANMAKLFFAYYAQTGNRFWKILALSVIKRGYLTIKPSKYFDKALNKFNKSGFKKIKKQLLRSFLNDKR